MTFLYSFGGLRVRSAIRLPSLAPADEGGTGWAGELALHAVAGAPLEPEEISYAWQNGYRLRLGPKEGSWLIRSRFDGTFLIGRDGRSVTIVASALPPDDAVIEILLRRVLTRVPVLQGAIAVHAASLSLGGAGLLLIGPSGAGKSTLCAALAVHGGWQILGDDTALLWHPEAPMLGGGAMSVCLWPESHEGFQIPYLYGIIGIFLNVVL